MTSVKSVRGRQPIIGPARLYPGAIPLNAAAYKGAWAFGANRMAFSDGVSWNELISNVTTLTTKTVGPVPGNDFATLGAALAYFAGFNPSAAQYDFLGRIIIRNSVTLAEQVLMTAQDLGWVTIESETLTTTTVARASNTSTVTFSSAHGLAVGRTFSLSGCTNSSFNILLGTVTGVPSATSIEYAQTASNVTSTADTTGKCYVDINVDRSAFAIADLFLDGVRFFLNFIGGTAPIVNCRFKATGTAPTNPATGNPFVTIGLGLRTSSFVSLPDPGLTTTPPTTHSYKAGIYGFSENIRVAAGAVARIINFETANATQYNVLSSAATCVIQRSRVRGSTGTHNTFFDFGSSGLLFATDFQTTAGSSAITDAHISGGSVLSIGSTSLGGTVQNEIVPSGSGIIFDDRVGLVPIWEGFVKPQSYTVATLPSAATNASSMIYVSDESGGATVAFSDGINWRRVQDRNIVS